VEVYKNQTADQIEGGIAGIINIVTRRPLDSKNNYFVLNADMNYGDLRNRATPEISGLISHQWDTDIGRFGVLASASYSDISEQVDNARVTTYRDYRSAGTAASNPGVVASDRGGLTGGTPGVDYYVPLGGGYSRQDNDRKRIGASAAAQWESVDSRMLATLQYIHSNTIQTYTERTIAPVEDTGNIDIVGGVGAATFDANNVFRKGTVFSGGGNGIDTQELNRGERLRSTTDDYSAHLQWKPVDRLHIDFDTQYATSSSYTLDTSVVAIASTVQTLDTTGEIPRISFAQPTRFSGNFDNTPGAATKGYNNQPIGFYTSGTSPTADPNTTFWRSAQDHQDNTGGNEFAFRADGVYDVGDGLLKRVKFGARYADRKQTIRSDGYNWGNLSERWNDGITTAAQSTPAGFGTIGIGNFFRGSSPQNLTIYGFLDNPAVGYGLLQSGVQQIKAVHPSFGYNPLYVGTRNGSSPNPGSIANGAGDGFHTLGELSKNDEETIGGYGRIDFAVPERASGRWKIDGNVGLRYVHTNSTSSGYYNIPGAQSIFQNAPLVNGVVQVDCTTPGGGRSTGNNGQPSYNICLNTPEVRNQIIKFFGTGGGTYTPNVTSQGYNDFLPSFNLRVAPSNTFQARFAYSKAITRPSFNDLRNYTRFFLSGPVGTLTADQPFPNTAVRAEAYGNPLLRPTKSDNFDVTFEWYHSSQGSLTFGLFYKDLVNVTSVLNGIAGFNMQSNGYQFVSNVGVDPKNPSVINYTNNGVTLPAFISVTANNNRHVAVKGLEVDWRENKLPFLTGALDGIGFSANFTYIDADKLQFQPVLAKNYDNTRGYNPDVGYSTSFAFPGVSKYNANAELFYEKYGLQARVAYTWRSSYFVSSQDALGPNDPTYTGSTGFMDASIFYAVDKHLKIGVTGSNLLNETVTTYNQISQSGIRALRGVNQQDRRYTIGVRMGF